jgi:hypothetical protein
MGESGNSCTNDNDVRTLALHVRSL